MTLAPFNALSDPRLLADLAARAATAPRYARLAILAAANLGRPCDDASAALRWLRVNASETTERGVLGEINAVRDIELAEVTTPISTPRKSTARTLTAALRRAGYQETVVQGKGYVYLVDGASLDWFSTSIPVCYTSDLDDDKIVRYRQALATDVRNS